MSLHGYPGDRADWKAFDRDQGSETPDALVFNPRTCTYSAPCGGCDGPLEDDGSCLSCGSGISEAKRAADWHWACRRAQAAAE